MFDVIIRGGQIADGTGKDAYIADIGIKNGKIMRIGKLSEEEAEREIDAAGCYVTPGFIDPHSHADLSLLMWPRNEAYTLQGVTTQICGNCGLSAAPIGDEFWEFWCWEYRCMRKTYKHLFTYFDFQTPAAEMKKQIKEDYGLDVNWKTLGEFMNLVEEKGISCNYYPLSGHNHIRNAVMGREYRPATEEELERMKAILRDDMEHGSQGFSTGLDYTPGFFSDTKEVEELIKVAGEYGGVYASHVRSMDPAKPGEPRSILMGVREATELCRRTGVKTNISHMQTLFEWNPDGEIKNETEAAIASVKELEKGWREEGLPIMYDVIANSAMGGSTLPHLICIMDPWVQLCGSVERFIEKLEYPDFVELIRNNTGKETYFAPNTPLHIHVAQCSDERFSGKELSVIMEENGLPGLLDAILEVLKADPYAGMIFVMDGGEEGVRVLLESERAVPCSDGFAFDLDTQMDLPSPFNRPPHPNNFCYAIRYLLYYGSSRFEDKIRQMTSIPAEWFNIHDRGTLEEGKWADIVVIDRDNLKTNENYLEPGQAPDGINYVLINGVVTADHKKHTGAMAGKVLRRQ